MVTSARIRIRDRFCPQTAPSSLHPDMLVVHAVHVDCARAFPLPSSPAPHTTPPSSKVTA